jgi:hypothetical protein
MIRQGDDKVALRAIELLWSTQAQLASRNEHASDAMNSINQPSLIRDREDAIAAMELLRDKRKELERERMEQKEARHANSDRPTE